MGGAGSGKSVNVARQFILMLMDERYRGSNLLVVRKVEGSHKNSTFAELCRAASLACGERYRELWEVRESGMEMRCKATGNSIIFCGFHDAKQREKVKSVNFTGGKLTWIWIEEATEISQQDFEILDDRLRGELPPNLFYQITLTFNPVSSRHWIKKRFFDSGEEEAELHHSTYLDNRFIDDAYRRRMERRKRFDPEGYRVYALGEWGQSEGKILTNYRVERVEQTFDNAVYGQDFGFNHANAILAVGFTDEKIFVFDEIYRHGMDTSELITLAEGRLDKRRLMICDSAEPDRIRMWKKAGYRAVPARKGNGSVSAQIDFLKQHTLIIDPRCQNLLSELDQWQWKRDGNGEFLDIPAEGPDDAIAALRYAVSHRICDGGITFLT